MTVQEAIKYSKDKGARMVDLKFCDLMGMWQHFTIPISGLVPDLFEEGLGFDGSSIRGWRGIEESDMVVRPDPATARNGSVYGSTHGFVYLRRCSSETLQPYNRDPRQILRKAVAYLKSTGIADVAYFGPEAEFLFSTMFVTIRLTMLLSIKLIQTRVPGIPAAMKAEKI